MSLRALTLPALFLFAAVAAAKAPSAPPMPPPPPDEPPVILFPDADTYSCGDGRAMTTASALYDFQERYGARHDPDHPVVRARAEGVDGALRVDMPRVVLEDTGTATVVVALEADGTLLDLVVECATHEDLAHYARWNVRPLTFRPATVDGKPVADTLHLTVRFARR
jgi:hypothetical protein